MLIELPVELIAFAGCCLPPIIIAVCVFACELRVGAYKNRDAKDL